MSDELVAWCAEQSADFSSCMAVVNCQPTAPCSFGASTAGTNTPLMLVDTLVVAWFHILVCGYHHTVVGRFFDPAPFFAMVGGAPRTWVWCRTQGGDSLHPAVFTDSRLHDQSHFAKALTRSSR